MKLAHLFIVIALALSVISAQALPVFTDGPPSSLAGTNANYSFTFTATGATPITFAVTAGALPTGLTLSSAGVISGIPNAADAGTTYTGTVTATDTNGLMTTQAFSIAVSTTLLNTVPEGVVNISLSPASTTYLSLPFAGDPFYRGVVSSVIAVTATTIAVDDSPAPWTAGEFIVPANGNGGTATVPYLVKFLSGNEMGRVLEITGNTTNSLTLDVTDNSTGQAVNLTSTSPTAFNVRAGDAFEIFPADTLGSVFGQYTSQAATWTGTTTTVTLSEPNSAIQVGATVTGTGISTGTTVTAISGATLTLSTNTTATETGVILSFTGAAQLVLVGGPDNLDADVVSIYNPGAFKFQPYFFNTTTGYWEVKGSAANANNTILYPYGALSVFRLGGTTAISLPLMGRIPEVPVLTKAGTSSIVYGSSGYPVPLTLSQISLGANWQPLSGTDFLDADVLQVYTPGSFKFISYYQLPAPNSTNWRTKASATNVGGTITVNPGDVISLFQNSSVVGGASFLSPAMPYSIDAYTNF